jgi:aspartate aminotransferase-like enzyme
MLQLAYEQGMAYRIKRHVNRRDATVKGLDELGLTVFADPAYRLPPVTCVLVPEGIDPDRLRERLVNPYRLDIGGGLGSLQGKLWRIGIMSHSAQPTFLIALLTAIETILEEEGLHIREKGAAVRALIAHLDP